jgi:hypothetical protein
MSVFLPSQGRSQVQRLEPRGQHRRGATGTRAYSATNGGLSPSATGCLSAPASAAFLCPGPLFGRLARPSWGLAHRPCSRWAADGSAPLLAFQSVSGRPGPPGSRAISPSFQAPAVCTWEDGWRHPRPVAANDADIISGCRKPPGIGAPASASCELPADLTQGQRTERPIFVKWKTLWHAGEVGGHSSRVRRLRPSSGLESH